MSRLLRELEAEGQPGGGANAKQLNLSMIFNSGRGSIAHQLGLPVTNDSFVDDFGHTVKFIDCSLVGKNTLEYILLGVSET